MTTTAALHRLTSYEPGRAWDVPVEDPRILQGLKTNDFERTTPFVKQYATTLPRIALPREFPSATDSVLEVLAGTAHPAAAALDLPGLSRLLHLSAGVVRTRTDGNGFVQPFRASGSAGARFPLELYVAIPEGGIAPGVHWYDPVEHALVRVGPAPLPEQAAATLIVTGIPWRTGWRYRERGYRHIYWDAGTMLSQTLALADSAGLDARLYTEFPDAAVSRLVGADGVHEWPVAVVALGRDAPALEAAGAAVAGVTDREPVEFPIETAAQRAGDLDRLAEPWQRAPAVPVPGRATATVDEVITKRGSQRRMNPELPLPRETLETCLALALRGIDIEHWVAVHAVHGLESGIYRWPQLDKPVRAGGEQEMRAELHRVCLGQALGRDAAFVVVAATDVTLLSDRGYRRAQLAAGLAEGRMHLAAYALGAGATGMTFLDSEIPALLPGGGPDALIFTCVGVPANASKAAGRPGEPTVIGNGAARKQ
ncbi:MAG TPA: nitroreductase family protein [Actinospica sp.]|nr:nitroreductase family protein [Actinospica sp.]